VYDCCANGSTKYYSPGTCTLYLASTIYLVALVEYLVQVPLSLPRPWGVLRVLSTVGHPFCLGKITWDCIEIRAIGHNQEVLPIVLLVPG
jgi:hypothetical protein